MSTQKHTTTYSMVIAQLLEDHRKKLDLNQGEFLDSAKITQSSWSRINRGLSHLTLEETRSACFAVGTDMKTVLADAEKVTKLLPEKEGIEILEGMKGSDNKSAIPNIIAGAALGFLVLRLLSK